MEISPESKNVDISRFGESAENSAIQNEENNSAEFICDEFIYDNFIRQTLNRHEVSIQSDN